MYNKSTRLSFECSSPNGILLFREVSQIVVTYGMRLPKETATDAYGSRYKGIWICMQIMTRCLGGNYINFGVFDLYKDPVLDVS